MLDPRSKGRQLLAASLCGLACVVVLASAPWGTDPPKGGAAGDHRAASLPPSSAAPQAGLGGDSARMAEGRVPPEAPPTPPRSEPLDRVEPSESITKNLRSIIKMELSVAGPQLELATASAGNGARDFLRFLQVRLQIEERERALEAIDAKRARVIEHDDIGKMIFGPQTPYVSWTASGDRGEAIVAVPLPSELTSMRNAIQETLWAVCDEVIDQHNRMSDEERSAMKAAYTSGRPWLVKQPLLMQLKDKLEYAGDSNLLRRRVKR